MPILAFAGSFRNMSERVDRRAFGVRLLAGTAVPVTAALGASAAEPAKLAIAPPEGPAPVADLSRVDLIVECVKRQYADPRLDEAALAEIRSAIERQLRQSEVLRRFPLTNSDQPATAFMPHRLEPPRRQEP
jgi:hypothetical protein